MGRFDACFYIWPIFCPTLNPDEPFFIRALKKVGFPTTPQCAKDGQEAIDYLAGEASGGDRARGPLPTHVVLDVKLPKKSGLEVLEWIRKDPRFSRLPVVMLTSSSQPADVERAYRLGADHYLIKPIASQELALVARALKEWIETGKLGLLPASLSPRRL